MSSVKVSFDDKGEVSLETKDCNGPKLIVAAIMILEKFHQASKEANNEKFAGTKCLSELFDELGVMNGGQD